MNGVVKVLKQDKGFGFIRPSEGDKDLFFHFSGCVGKVETYNMLTEGTEVTFETQPGKDGRPMAVDVQPL